jgi:hypothetical protein
MVVSRIRMCNLCAENPALVTELKEGGGMARYCQSCWHTESERIIGRCRCLQGSRHLPQDPRGGAGAAPTLKSDTPPRSPAVTRLVLIMI